MNRSSLASLFSSWWQEQARFRSLSSPMEPLTASGSQDQLTAPPQPARQGSRMLSSWGDTLAPTFAADAQDVSGAGAFATWINAGRADAGRGTRAGDGRASWSGGRDGSLTTLARAGFSGLSDPLASGLGLAGGPLCSCALCQGMAAGGEQRRLIDRLRRRSPGQEADPVTTTLPGLRPAQPQPAGASATAAAASIATTLTIADQDVFNLETNPGASKTIYLDFDGADLINTAWYGRTTWNGIAPAFTLDADTSTNFSAAELAMIKQIFARVACDFAPFNVNVTTKAPTLDRINRSSSSDSVYGTVCLFSNISSQTNYPSAGGVAYVGVFNSVNAENLKPALVFPDKLANSAKYISEAASHEIGHNLGLSHDGTSTVGYYEGQGNSPGWAPIMGVGYYRSLTQFSRGTYPGANNTQNDFSLIAAEGVSYWLDAVGNDRSSATALTLSDANGDGISDKLQIGGAIELTASDGLATPDQDVYGFLAPSNGSVTINVRNALYFFDPALSQYSYAAVPSGYGNLRLDARLLDDSGVVLADWSNNASLDITNFSVSGLNGGRNYYLSVLANTSSPDLEDTYGSLGDYIVDLVYQGQPVPSGTPVVSVAVSTPSVDEDSGTPLSFTFSRSGPIDAELSININVSGTASAGGDFTGVAAGAGSLLFAAGSDTATLQVTPLADSSIEADETVVVAVVSGSGYTFGSPSSATGTIRNDDLPPTYSLSAATSVEEGQTLAIGISTTGVADGTPLNWRLSGAGVSAGDVSPAALSGSVTVTAAAASFSLGVVADNDIEPTESALFELLSGTTVVASQTISLVDTNVLWGSAASDSITGADNRFERLSGALASGTTASALGTGQLDVVTGGLGADEFLLSETRSGSLRVFYNDTNNRSTGLNDHLRITDFNASQDTLRVAGGRYFSRNSGSDTQIWWDRNSNGALNTVSNQNSSDELIAVLAGANLGSFTINNGSTANPAWMVYG